MTNGLKSDPFVIELTDKLDGLPLALATAGTYLRHIPTSLQAYLRHYDNSWLKLQTTTPYLSSYEKALYTTWNISLEYVQGQNILAAKLLRLWAYFDHQDLWYQLLAAGKYGTPEWFFDLVDDEIKFNQAIGLLCDHALVERLENSDGYGMHTCVHAWTVHVLNAEKDIEMARTALICVSEFAPDKHVPERWKLGQRLLSHARQCSIHIRDSIIPDIEQTESTMSCIHNLGHLYSNQGKLKEAEDMYVRALTGRENSLGAVAVNNLGNVYLKQGNLEKAGEMYLRALTGYEKVWGAEHVETLDIVNNLGALYRQQGNLEKAEETYLRALRGYEKVWGAEISMPSMLGTINNLGIVYEKQGNFEKAEEMYLRALTEYEKIDSGQKGFSNTIYNLAVLYKNWSRFEDAAKNFELAAECYTNLLGSEHRMTVKALKKLEQVSKKLNKKKERLPLRSNG